MSDTPARYSEDICGELYQCPEGEYIFYEYYEESQKELAAKTAECAELRKQLEAALKRPTKYEDKPYIPSHDRDGFGG